MRIERRRVVYGSVIGVGTFLTGVALVWLTTPVENVGGHAPWRVALRMFLDANGVAIDPGATDQLLLSDTGPEVPTLQLGWAFPLLLVALGAILTASGVSGTVRPRYLLENGSTVLYGYLGIGLVGLIESGARPAVAGITFLLLLSVVALYVGGTVTQKMTGGLPFIGVASLGLVMILGLLFVLAGVTIITAMLPMVVVGVAGVVLGLGLYWGVRSAPR